MKAKSKKKNMNKKELKREIIGILLIVFSILYLLSIFTYSPVDPPNSSFNGEIKNFIGIIGAYLSYFFLFIFGNLSFIIPLIFIYSGIKLILNTNNFKFYKILSILGFFLSISMILNINNIYLFKKFKWGGVLIEFLSKYILLLFGEIGTYILLSSIMILLLGIIFNVLFKNILYKIFSKIKNLKKLISFPKIIKKTKKTKKIKGRSKNKKSGNKKSKVMNVEYYQVKISKNSKNDKAINTPKKKNNQNEEILEVIKKTKSLIPPKELLNYLEKTHNSENFDKLKYKLEDALDEFGIEGKVVNIETGPMASLYEVDVKKGTKVRKITSLDKDLALMMSKSNIRIIAPLPHKGTVGFEIPNKLRQFVSLRELLEDKKFKNYEADLGIAFGRGMNGEAIVIDIAQLPHLLISGATNSGKSIGIHTIIMSILYRHTHEDVKFIMIDPKRLEFPYYNGLPHLLSEVIVEPKEAVNILKWALYEMEKRYEKLSNHGYRNIQAYHKNEDEKDMPYIIIIVDEMADLIMNTGQDVEHSIIRLAQMSRAVGIHLILATQRPSVDIITGTIKANFPSRVAYKTATRNNSRIILDETGAENLLGKGDFLYRSIDGNLIRGQGALVTVEEIEKTVEYFNHIEVEEDDFQEVFEKEKEISVELDDKDDLYTDVLQIIYNLLKNGKETVSISYLQRKLRIGYNRSARIVDTLAEDGIVDTQNISNKGRPILVDEKTLEEYIDY